MSELKMIVYQYDEKTGFPAGMIHAQESPREAGVYLVPANSTEQKPPQTGERECAVYESGKWVLKPDYRGVTYYLPDGTKLTIDHIGIMPPENALFEMPPPTLEDIRSEKLKQVESAFMVVYKTAHCLSSAGFEINADETANRNLEGLVLVLAEGESTLFRAYDNRFYEVTKEQLEMMRKEIVFNSQRLYQLKWQFEAAIDAAETIDELSAIDITFETARQEEGEDNGQKT